MLHTSIIFPCSSRFASLTSSRPIPRTDGTPTSTYFVTRCRHIIAPELVMSSQQWKRATLRASRINTATFFADSERRRYPRTPGFPMHPASGRLGTLPASFDALPMADSTRVRGRLAISWSGYSSCALYMVGRFGVSAYPEFVSCRVGP